MKGCVTVGERAEDGVALSAAAVGAVDAVVGPAREAPLSGGDDMGVYRIRRRSPRLLYFEI